MERLHVKYSITWDFLNAHLFTFEKNELIELKKYPTYCFSDIQEAFRGDIQEKIKTHLKLILNDLKQIHEEGHLHDFIPDKTFFIQLLRESVELLSPIFITHIHEKRKDRHLDDEIKKWALLQGIANPNNESFNEMLASQLVYRLIGRIIFYLTLRRHFTKILPELLPQDGLILPDEYLKSAFAEARKIDWQAVFEEDITERIGFPVNGRDTLLYLLKELNRYNFSQLKEDVIGEIFEELIPQEKRHSLGQYFTKEDLVDFIIGFVIKDKDKCYIDPTCGSGTFLNRAYSRLRHLSGYTIEHHNLLEKLWGVDIAHFPAELATINLFRHDIRDYNNFPKIIVKDFFEINPGDLAEFPSPMAKSSAHNKVTIPIPIFNGVVGNFPYIRQELIEKQTNGYKKFLTECLATDWIFDYPDLFDINKRVQLDLTHGNLQDVIKKNVTEQNITLKLSGQADIYTYLFFHTAKFMEINGRMGIIVSNSWLDVAYGLELKKFFLDKFKIIAIVSSWVEPWFEDAAVNTVFVILEYSENKEENLKHKARFVKLKKKLKDLIQYSDLKLDESKRWNKIDSLVNKIEMASKEMYKFDKTIQYNVINNIETYEDAEFRVRMIPQADLLNEINEKKELAKWGKYLRAPDIYFEILEKANDKLVPLREVADVRRGYTTGINEFFYFSKADIEKWKIEEEFLKPVIKSPKEAETIEIDPSKLKFKLFMCNKSKEELRKEGKINALKYIEDGEKRRTKDGVPFPEVPSVQGRKHWWSIEERFFSPNGWFESFGSRFLTLNSNTSLFFDKRFYEIRYV